MSGSVVLLWATSGTSTVPHLIRGDVDERAAVVAVCGQEPARDRNPWRLLLTSGVPADACEECATRRRRRIRQVRAAGRAA